MNVDTLLELSPDERRAVLSTLSNDQALALLYDWAGLWCRPKQRPPVTDPPWLNWFLCGGRGSGKTRPAAEWVIDKSVRQMPGSRGFIAARTLDDVRTTCIEGDSGVLACLHPGIQRKWNRTICELTIRVGDKGTAIKGFSSEKPASGRGPQHHWGWADEIAAWLKDGELWDQLLFGLRLPWPGQVAQAVITTTPRPIKRIRDFFARAGKLVTMPDGSTFTDVVKVTQTTYENMANLSASALALVQQFEGTKQGRQELLAELLEDVDGSLWRREWFGREGFRIPQPRPEQLELVLVAIDAALTDHARAKGDEHDSDLTGITAIGKLAHPREPRQGEEAWPPWLGWNFEARKMEPDPTHDHFVVLADRSMRASPGEWARAAKALAEEWNADAVVAETNRGGDLVEGMLREVWPDVNYRGVHAAKGKRPRAEPIATMYEQGRVHHSMGADLEALEDEFSTWVPGIADSPDRLDSAVWGLTAATEFTPFRLR